MALVGDLQQGGFEGAHQLLSELLLHLSHCKTDVPGQHYDYKQSHIDNLIRENAS